MRHRSAATREGHPEARYEGIAEIKNLLLLSFAAYLIPFDLQGNVNVRESLDAVHSRIVLHGDAARRNLLYDEPSARVVVINFDQAKILHARGGSHRASRAIVSPLAAPPFKTSFMMKASPRTSLLPR